MRYFRIGCFSFLLLLLSSGVSFGAWSSGNTNYWIAYGLTGGSVGLDGISGVSIGPTDRAITFDISGGTVYFHRASLGSEAEATPTTIRPDDVGGGVTSWVLTGVRVSVVRAGTLYVDTTRWDDGSGGMSSSVVRAGVTGTVFDKATDGIEQILSGTSDQFIVYNISGNAVVVDPASGREAFGVKIGTDVLAYDAGVMSGDSEAGVPTGTWDFTGGIIAFNAADVEATLEAALDIEDLVSGTSKIFDKATDELEQILSGTSDQIIAYDTSGAAVVLDPVSAREALNAGVANHRKTSIGFSWHATDGHLNDSIASGGIAGVSTAPIRIPFDCSIGGVYLASSQGAATGKVQVFHTSGMNLPTSGESLFGGTAAYVAGVSLVASPLMFDDDSTYVAGVTTLNAGDTLQFMAQDLGSGITDFIIMVEVEKI